jgi:hypothetical protein
MMINPKATWDAAKKLAELPSQDRKSAIELAEVMVSDRASMPIPQRAEPRQKRTANRGKHWTDEELLLLMQFEEDSKLMSKSECRRKRRAFARTMNRSDDAIARKLYTMRKESEVIQ